MSEISVGSATNNLKTATVMWQGFSDDVAAEEVVYPDLSGSIGYTTGASAVVFSGRLEVGTDIHYGTADFQFLLAMSRLSWFYLKDHKNVTRKVIWASPFSVSWVGQGANFGYIPFTFIELKE